MSVVQFPHDEIIPPPLPETEAVLRYMAEMIVQRGKHLGLPITFEQAYGLCERQARDAIEEGILDGERIASRAMK